MVEAKAWRRAARTGLAALVAGGGSFTLTAGALSAGALATDPLDGSSLADDSPAAADGEVEVTFDESERELLSIIATSSTVQVRASECDGATLGSGVILDGRIVTAAHLIPEGADLSAGANSVRLAALDRSIDLAVLDGTTVLDGAVREVRSTPPVAGEPVLVAGHAAGGPLRVIEASVHHVDIGAVWGLDTEVVVLDRALQPGYSGGPVLDRHGRLVGLIHGFDAVSGLSIVVPLPENGLDVDVEPGTATGRPDCGETG